MKKQIKAFFKGFVYAFNGIAATVKTERNFRFHIVAAIYVYAFSAFYNFALKDYVLITLCVASVMSAELINSAIERAVANPDKAHDALAGTAKDMAAGAVLITALSSAACGIMLFWNMQIFKSIWQFFCGKIWPIPLFIISVIAAIFFIFKNEENQIDK